MMSPEQKFAIMFAYFERQEWFIGDKDVEYIAAVIARMEKEIFS